jgi:hypothetical protein
VATAATSSGEGLAAVFVRRTVKINHAAHAAHFFQAELMVLLPSSPGQKERVADVIVVVDDTPERREFAERILGSIRPL